MAVITSLIDPHDESVRATCAAMRALVADLRTRTAAAGTAQVRERIDRLIDADAAFLELSPLAQGMDGGNRPGAGIVTGIGWVDGVACMIVADDVAAGNAIDATTLHKLRRAHHIAAADGLPCIYLVDGGGRRDDAADGPASRRIDADDDELGSLLAEQARMSAAGIAQVVLLLGSDDGQRPRHVGPGDETVALSGRGHAAADYLARDELHALGLAREIVAGMAKHPAAVPWARLPSRPPAVTTPDSR